LVLFAERVESVKKAFWKCIRKSHQRPAVQHTKFVLLDTEKNRGPYYPTPLVLHGEQNSIFTLLKCPLINALMEINKN